MNNKPLTIGVFDSGFGGLTVLRALLPLVPGAHYIYLGDTARLPYGSKSRETIARYAVSSSRFLLDQGADILVIACNTATALALPEIQSAAAIRTSTAAGTRQDRMTCGRYLAKYESRLSRPRVASVAISPGRSRPSQRGPRSMACAIRRRRSWDLIVPAARSAAVSLA